MTTLTGTFSKKSFRELAGELSGRLGGLKITNLRAGLEAVKAFSQGAVQQARTHTAAAIKIGVQFINSVGRIPYADRAMEDAQEEAAKNKAQHRLSATGPKIRPGGP